MPPTNACLTTASTAACSPPEPPPGGLCAIHPPNLFPCLATPAKLFAADYWIVLDDVQFTAATTSTAPASPACSAARGP